MGRLRRFLSGLGDGGATTVEFGLIGGSYIVMLMAAMEIGFLIFLQGVLDNAARDAARQIRTGQVQLASSPTTTFSNLLCSEVGNLIPCSSLIYQSQAFWQWSEASSSMTTPVSRNSNGNLVSSGFNGGSPGEIVIVQVTYNYSFFTPLIGALLGGTSQSALLQSTVVFQNEPF